MNDQSKVTWLSGDALAAIETQYYNAIEAPHGTGEHIALISLLNQHDLNVNGWEQAAELALWIIEHPYSDPNSRGHNEPK